MIREEKVFNDDFDLASILTVLFDNFNLLISIFVSSVFLISIYYLSSQSIYQSNSLIEVKKENTSFLPDSFSADFAFGTQESMEAEIEIYRSNNTISDAIISIKKTNNKFNVLESLTVNNVRDNLSLKKNGKSLIAINFLSEDKELSRSLLDALNEEFISDRKEFIQSSSAAGRKFVNQEIPRIKKLLKNAEDNLNNFKISTNTSDVIFDTNTRNLKLERLKNRVNEIEFKELELKEFYKENHPIYITLSEQKKLVLAQINEIEADLPNVPSNQRALENFKREIDIYSNVLRELSELELSLGMTEASVISNVRIINYASEAVKISPKILLFLFAIISTIFAYILLLIRHFIGDKITNLDALMDFVGKESVIGEIPELNKNSSSDTITKNISDELLNKAIYELKNLPQTSFAIVSSRKDVGKSDIAFKIFSKLNINNKVCLLDLDYRKKGLTKEHFEGSNFSNFKEFYEEEEKFKFNNDSLFVPSFQVDSPQDYFSSDEFQIEIKKLIENYDYVICDTPPWKLFVDSKIISKLFDIKIYVVCNKVSSFKDIQLFMKDFNEHKSIFFIYNRFKMYFNFLWYKYQYPYYSRNYYYDYLDYSGIRNNLSKNNFYNLITTKLVEVTKSFINILKNIFSRK